LRNSTVLNLHVKHFTAFGSRRLTHLPHCTHRAHALHVVLLVLRSLTHLLVGSLLLEDHRHAVLGPWVLLVWRNSSGLVSEYDRHLQNP
jgi:hypothetical protein